MAYTPLPSKSDTDTLTLPDYNKIKDNFAAGVPDIIGAKGDLPAGTAANAAARLTVGADDATLVADSLQTTGLAWQIQPAAIVTKSATTTMTADEWTTLDFDGESVDTDGMHDTGTNPSRLTVPTGGAGLYLFGFVGRVDDGSPTKWQVRFLLNGTTEIGAGGMSSYDYGPLSVTIPYVVSEGDRVEVQYYSDGADTISASPKFWAVWQRRA